MPENTLTLLESLSKNTTMDIQAEKIDLMQKILQIRKESIIEKIKKILDKEMTVAYTVSGKPLTQKAYNKRLEKAEEQIQKGATISQEDLEQEMKTW